MTTLGPETPLSKANLRVRRQENYLRGIVAIIGTDFDDAEGDADALTGYASVHILSAVFKVPTWQIANDVIKAALLLGRKPA